MSIPRFAKTTRAVVPDPHKRKRVSLCLSAFVAHLPRITIEVHRRRLPHRPDFPLALDGAVQTLTRPQGLGERSRIILAHFDYGPELLYRTPHAIIAAPYYSNSGGLLESDRIFRSRDLDLSRRLMGRRGVDLVLVCRDEAGPEAAFGADTFLGGLVRGRVPSWLRPVDLPAAQAANIVLYEVVR